MSCHVLSPAQKLMGSSGTNRPLPQSNWFVVCNSGVFHFRQNRYSWDLNGRSRLDTLIMQWFCICQSVQRSCTHMSTIVAQGSNYLSISAVKPQFRYSTKSHSSNLPQEVFITWQGSLSNFSRLAVQFERPPTSPFLLVILLTFHFSWTHH
ncbi:hypothetical protein E4T56_gene15275 [Termitomyces sp. T112]|nr:hypothetical protein E4T56_gene15275 [Termitomyces sp. T112]